VFTPKGYMNYVVSYGTEQHLPLLIRDKIQGAYEDYKITHVANVKVGGRDIWVTNLESLNHMVRVRLEEDELEEVEKYVRSK
jgi:hypothetical protein